MSPRCYGFAPLALLLLTIAACGGKSTDVDGDDAEPIEWDVQITVENRNWQDITVFAMRGGNRMRLGLVTSMQTRNFTLKSDMTQSTQFRLIADPVGSLEVFESDNVRIERGDQIRWTLAGNLTHSGLFIF